MKKAIDFNGFPICAKSHCKRAPFGLRFGLFWKTIWALLESVLLDPDYQQVTSCDTIGLKIADFL